MEKSFVKLRDHQTLAGYNYIGTFHYYAKHNDNKSHEFKKIFASYITRIPTKEVVVMNRAGDVIDNLTLSRAKKDKYWNFYEIKNETEDDEDEKLGLPASMLVKFGISKVTSIVTSKKESKILNFVVNTILNTVAEKYVTTPAVRYLRNSDGEAQQYLYKALIFMNSTKWKIVEIIIDISKDKVISICKSIIIPPKKEKKKIGLLSLIVGGR